MNRKLLLISAVIAAIGAFTLTRPNSPAVPSDLRDAVAEGAQEFDTAIPKLDKTSADIPEPAESAVYSSQGGSAGSFQFKGLLPYRKWPKPVLTPEDGGKAMGGSPRARDKAAARLREVPGATAFDKLKNLFAQGVPATKQDLLGWHAGRTVYASNKDLFFGALVAGIDVPLNPGGGPLFEGKKAFKLVFPLERTPDYFDAMDADRIAQVEDRIKNTEKEKMFPMSFPDAEGAIEDWSFLARITERKSGDYLVDYWVATDKKTGKSEEAYAYYFKDVTPKK